MPIGISTRSPGRGGGGGAVYGSWERRTDWGASLRETAERVWEAVADVVERLVTAVRRVLGTWAWVAVRVNLVEPVAHTAWVTAADERVCPECGPLSGLVWEEGFGPVPPLHVNCRCARSYAYTEWRVRPLTRWEQRWVPM